MPRISHWSELCPMAASTPTVKRAMEIRGGFPESPLQQPRFASHCAAGVGRDPASGGVDCPGLQEHWQRRRVRGGFVRATGRPADVTGVIQGGRCGRGCTYKTL